MFDGFANLSLEWRGLSLLQPWASLMAFGEKHIETRSWYTPYRGRVAIAASARSQTDDLIMSRTFSEFREALRRHGIEDPSELPLGKILCTGRLIDCVPTEYFDLRRRECAPNEEAFGNYAAERYAWVFDGLLALPEPIAVKGSLGLYKLPEPTVELLEAA
jgi:hypothetical protein